MTTPPAHDLLVDSAPVSSLRTFHKNPRKGNVATIRESLRVNGQYRPIVANRGTHTGRPNEVLAGNHTLMAARDEGWGQIQVAWVDVDDDQCSRIVAADNRTADLGGYDDRLLVELLADLPDLAGTGYDLTDFEALERLVSEPEDLDGLANKLGPGDQADLWPALRLVLPPMLLAAWRAHLATCGGKEVEAFAALLQFDLSELPSD